MRGMPAYKTPREWEWIHHFGMLHAPVSLKYLLKSAISTPYSEMIDAGIMTAAAPYRFRLDSPAITITAMRPTTTRGIMPNSGIS